MECDPEDCIMLRTAAYILEMAHFETLALPLLERVATLRPEEPEVTASCLNRNKIVVP